MADAVRLYAVLGWTWLRAAAQFPVSLALLCAGTAAVTSLDLAAILILFAHTPSIAGFTAPEVLFLYGTSALCFATSDLLLGTADRLGEHVRRGTLDAMLVRPVSPLLQLAAEDFSPRRMARAVPPALVLALVLPRLDWTPGRLAMLPVLLACGVVIFCALWVLTASVQFVMIDGHPATKAVTYGGAVATQYPMSIYARDMVRGLTFCVPLAFVNWEPALYILDRPDPLGLPGAARFASPAVAAVLCAAAAVAWRAGLRHYRSTGS